MKSAWTGGQYSLFRAILGFSLSLCFLLNRSWMEAALATFFALGLFDRSAALALAIWLSVEPQALGEATEFDALLIASLLLMHCWLPAAPIGSLAARGRLDPGIEWRFPRWISGLLWAEILLVHGLLIGTASQPVPLFGLLWLQLAALGFTWVRPARPHHPTTIFFDGECGLCHGVVRWVLAEDGTGIFHFSPLQGTTYAQAFHSESQRPLPNTVLVWIEKKHLLSHSDAVLYIMARLGGLWRIFALGLRLIPRTIRDLGYRWVARVRTRLFAKPKQSCPMVPPGWAGRFLP